mmetsp:Transcript_28827/g.73873  ORF Transcript_28827/g.73873 Transcript_28827/m.73873 type:complete len:203 (+) Transcript_28827:119-727(+)
MGTRQNKNKCTKLTAKPSQLHLLFLLHFNDGERGGREEGEVIRYFQSKLFLFFFCSSSRRRNKPRRSVALLTPLLSTRSHDILLIPAIRSRHVFQHPSSHVTLHTAKRRTVHVSVIDLAEPTSIASSSSCCYPCPRTYSSLFLTSSKRSLPVSSSSSTSTSSAHVCRPASKGLLRLVRRSMQRGGHGGEGKRSEHAVGSCRR